MKKRMIYGWLATLLVATTLLSGCGAKETEAPQEVQESAKVEETPAKDHSDKIASESETVEAVEVEEEGMQAIAGIELKDGTYDIVVDSSSEMFNITSAKLTVVDGIMSCDMTMGGTGYLYLYNGIPEDAVDAGEDELIPFTEDSEGAHHFVVPVAALDHAENYAAFSKKKEKWYGRQLCFRADSLPLEAFVDDMYDTVASLEVADGEYLVDVTLTGGSGKASVDSPAYMWVADGKATVSLVWSSPNYDYMVVGGEKYLPVNTDGNSQFDIPVEAFNYRMPVTADTTAMSTPHEIAYHITLDGNSIKEIQ